MTEPRADLTDRTSAETYAAECWKPGQIEWNIATNAFVAGQLAERRADMALRSAAPLPASIREQVGAALEGVSLLTGFEGSKRDPGSGKYTAVSETYVSREQLEDRITSLLSRAYRQAGAGATLPCDVRLPPHTTITKGCRYETLLLALEQRAKWTAEGRDVSFAQPLPEPPR